jgi:transcriptional regulator with XRE-family HTH domain
LPTATDTLCGVSSDWERLGKLITAERRRRKLNMAALSVVSGLGTSTLDNIEHGRKTSYDPGTLSALEDALGWRTGSIERVLSGLEPLPVEDPDLRAVLDAWPGLSAGSRRMLAVLATEAARADRREH